MPGKIYKILLVEDDYNLGFMLEDNLSMAGYKVQRCMDGAKALGRFINDKFHLCLFDVMLPGKDGFILAQEIRQINKDIPIIFLTARGQKEDRIKGFKAGGDDYLSKPFSIEELILRIEAVLRRVYHEDDLTSHTHIISLGGYKLDTSNQQLLINGRVISLTRKESQLLGMLGSRPNSILERKVIMKAIWEDDGYFVARSMDVFISRLRKYLKDDPRVNIINIHGVGYRLEVK